MSSPRPSPFWSKDRHRDRRLFLVARARIVAALRRWFEAEGFLIVEPAALQVSPGNETHLHAFLTELVGPDGRRATRYLHTSPEFAMKKLLAAGEERIAAFAPVYRNRESGPLHAPEFTMLELVPGRRPLRDGDEGYAGNRRRGRPRRGVGCPCLARTKGRSVRTRRAGHRRRRLPPPCRHRPLRRDGPRPAGRGGRTRGTPGRGGRHVVGHLQPHPGREGRAGARLRPADAPHGVPGHRGGARPRQPARRQRRRAIRALRLRGRTAPTASPS